MATFLPDAYDEALASVLRKGYADYVPGDTGNRWLMLHTADPTELGNNEVTGLSPFALALNEQQTLTITGGPTGGSFTITYSGQTTDPIAYNATAADVQAAMEALSTVGAGNVLCTGGPLPGSAVVIEFVRDLSQQSLALATADGSALTGGTTPDAAIAETVDGKDAFGTYADDVSSGGRLSDNDALLSLGTATVGETATHYSVQTAESGGQVVYYGTLVSEVTWSVDQPVEVPAGAFDIFGAGYP